MKGSENENVDVCKKKLFQYLQKHDNNSQKNYFLGSNPCFYPLGGGADIKGQIDISIEIKDLGAKTVRY